MSNVIAFTPRRRSLEPVAPAPLARSDLRTHLEEAAQIALDAADKIIAALDRMDGAPAGIEETVPAPDPERQGEFWGHYVRPRACLREEEPLPAAAEPEASPEALNEVEAGPEPCAPLSPLPWHGAGNVVAATGCAFLAMIGAA